MHILVDLFQVDKIVAVFLLKFSTVFSQLLLLICQVKRKLVLLESNQSRDSLDDRRKCQEKGIFKTPFFDILGGLYAFKNSSINLIFLALDNTL